MKFVTFRQGQDERAGLWLEGERVLDLAAAAALDGVALDASSMLALIRGGEAALAAARALHDKAGALGAAVLPAGSVHLLAPIPRPAKNVFCVGRNYLEHVKEGNAMRGIAPSDVPTAPNFFTKAPTTVVGPGAQVRYPAKLTKAFDYEVELAVIIGKDGRDIPPERAYEHVFGYSVLNDVTARDLQKLHLQWFKGKSLDTSCPMGPWIVDKAEIGDPTTLELTFHLNGQERQRATTDLMIFDIPAIIASLSGGMTLEAGDIIASGTPSGVGFAMDPPGLLKDGDVMTCEISRIGKLINTVVEV
ncbi:MAG TPA: fumarylacetoacetate hydrolase family protein [Caulobacteraceae bacterium]|nr:fumarylacetoacetate hydrolase family protein [Caulobacteraceae bacterium]